MRARRLCTLVVAGFALTGLPTLATATTASSAAATSGTAGYCPTEEGVTVVVDFNELGGGIVVRCAPGPDRSGYTGIDALQSAGFSPEGVRRWGLAFVCRLAGRPSAAETLPIDGNPDYREQCLNTPPLLAYWSYWSAPNGGDWAYSQSGPLNRDVIPGGFEGWSFSLNRQPGDTPEPGLRPRRPQEPPTTPPPTTPPPTHGPPTHRPPTHPPTTYRPPTHPPTPSSPPHQQPSSPAQSSPPPDPGAGSGAATSSATPPPPVSTAPPDGSSTAGAAAATSQQPGQPANPVAAGRNAAGEKVSGRLPAQVAAPSSSAGRAVVGLLVVGALGAGAALAARRRRAHRA